MSQHRPRIAWGTVSRLEAALKVNSSLTTFRDEIAGAPGFPEAYLFAMGLTKKDLLKLERAGFALRGYTQNAWAKGEELPNGKIAPTTMVGRGHQTRWIIISDRPEVRGAGGRGDTEPVDKRPGGYLLEATKEDKT